MSSGIATVGVAAQSAETGLEVDWEVPFGTSGDARLVMDIFRLPGSSGAVCVLFWHGGGFIVGGKGNMRFLPISGSIAYALASLGYVVFIPNYRLSRLIAAPPVEENNYPVPENDCLDAIAFVRANAATYGGDVDRIVVAGGSAGGSFSLWTGAQLAGLPYIKSIVGWSPGTVYCLTDPLDVGGGETLASYIARLSVHEIEVLFHMGQTSADGSYLNCAVYPAAFEAAQPISLIDPNQAPTHVQVSAQESMPAVIVIDYAAQAKALGVPWTLDINGTMSGALTTYADVTAGLAGEYTNVNPTLGVGDRGGAAQHADAPGAVARMHAYIQEDLLRQPVTMPIITRTGTPITPARINLRVEPARIVRTGTPLGIGVQHT